MKKKQTHKNPGKIDSIFIRELDVKQNVLLKRLRDDLQEVTNTKAVWGAVEKYFPLKDQIDRLNKNILDLENKLSRADQEVSEIREYVREYFAFQEDAEKRKDGYMKKLKVLVTEKRPARSRRTRSAGFIDDNDEV